MNRHLLLLILNFLSFCNFAQTYESFSDSTLVLSHTKWYGQTNDFKINTGHQLQSIGNATGVSLIFTPITTAASMEWEFWIKLNFAPSESNRLRIYLQSNDTIFSKADAYYLELGDNGNLDAVKFFRQSQNKAILLAEGTSGAVASEPVTARLKINKTSTGYWTLSADYLGGNDFKEEWSVLDTSIQMKIQQYFAFQCLYTSTRKDKFLFDDIFIHPDTIDHTPLRIMQVSSDSNEVFLYLNKPVDSSAASNEENYVISSPGGMPRKAKVIQDSIVQLTLVKSLLPGHYEIICKTFKDKNGISSYNIRAQWTHVVNPHLNPYELLISEIMIDPSPVIQLPAYEYIEIFNHSNHTIDLSSVSLKFETNIYPIDTASLLISPGQYLILCGSDAFESLKSFGNIYKMGKWPSLRNTSGTIGLYDSKDSLIHSVVYDDSWYRNSQKKDGGWSLEMINPDNVCDRQSNWIASKDPKGGTPGKVNSVFNINDHVSLKLDSIKLNNERITLFLNKSVLVNSASSFTFSPPLAIQRIEKNAPTDPIMIQLTNPLSSGKLYSLTITLHDCIDRPLEMIDTVIAKVESPGLNDLVISEILFNPFTGGSDFIEIYNRSNKIFSSENLLISNEITGKQITVRPSVLLLPSEYWVITPDPANIKLNYTVPHPEHLIDQNLPTLPDDHGQISVWSRNKVLIDSFTYDEKQQYDFLNSKDGVSLERIDFESPPIATNWHSASGSSGYATPTGKNSIAYSGSSNEASIFKLKNKVFSPNDDGVDDILSLEYALPVSGYLARIDIFDDQGRPVKRLANNLSLAFSGSIEWDGKNDEKNNCPPGIYIVSIQTIHEKEERINERKACVLVR